MSFDFFIRNTTVACHRKEDSQIANSLLGITLCTHQLNCHDILLLASAIVAYTPICQRPDATHNNLFTIVTS